MLEIPVTGMSKSMSIFEQASYYTLDPKLKTLLLDCSKAKWPSQFQMRENKIVTTRGYIHVVPRDPMDLCNLVHDILHGQDEPPITVIPESRHSVRNVGDIGVPVSSIYAFAESETRRLGLDDIHRGKLAGCIFTGILIGHLEPGNFTMCGERILAIDGLNTEIPDLINRHDFDSSRDRIPTGGTLV